MLDARERRRARNYRELAGAIRAAHTDGDLRSLIPTPQPAQAPRDRATGQDNGPWRPPPKPRPE